MNSCKLVRYSVVLMLTVIIVIGGYRWDSFLPGNVCADVFWKDMGSLNQLFRSGLHISELVLNGMKGNAVITCRTIDPNVYMDYVNENANLDHYGSFGPVMAYGWKERKSNIDVCLAMKTDDESGSAVQGLFTVPRYDLDTWGRLITSASAAAQLPVWAQNIALTADAQYCGMKVGGAHYELLYDTAEGTIRETAVVSAGVLTAAGWRGREEHGSPGVLSYRFTKKNRDIRMVVMPGAESGCTDLFLVATDHQRNEDG